MSFQTQNNTNSNESYNIFGRYNNTWDEVFNIDSYSSLFVTSAVSKIYGSIPITDSSYKNFINYVLDNKLTLNWSVVPGIDSQHHCFVNGPWNTHTNQLVCNGPSIDINLNHTKSSFQLFVMNSIGYNSTESADINYLNYKADIQLLHGYRSRRWAKYCILRIRLPSYYQLIGNLTTQHRDQISPSPERTTKRVNESSEEQNEILHKFTLIRSTPSSMFVRLNTSDMNDLVYECPSLYHRPLYLKYDSESKQYGYWIGLNNPIADRLKSFT